MQKEKIKKIAYISLTIATILFAMGGFFFSSKNVEAKSSVTKWQLLLQNNRVDPALWQKYLPSVNRKEYNAVKDTLKKMGSSAAQTTATTPTQTTSTNQTGSLGPEISVGLRYNSKGDTFKIDANRTYNIRKDDGGDVIAQIAGGSTTEVDYDSNGNLKISGSIASTSVSDQVWFDAADGDNSTIIFNTHGSDSYDHYRGKIEIHYYHGDDIYGGSSSTVTQIWLINKLPLEQYVWGMGETTGTGDTDHVRVMTTIFRTYGDWYIENATKYKPLGFKIRSDSANQIYGGYDWEKDHSHIKDAANDTRGKIVTYKGDVALTPYCSYTDGKTRALDGYPYLKSVKDHKLGIKKGLNPGDGGNHMWGLSAHGALGFAQDGKSWDWILKYYYTKVDISSEY
jgi:peptidoglycan hydrolase-like amidase